MIKRILLYPLLVILVAAVTSFVFFFTIGKSGLKARDANKPLLKNIVRSFDQLIYREAGKYNPQGDVIPDELDNAIKKELKKSIK
jgi:hypothetical protein